MASSTVMTSPLELPPVVNETPGCVCRSIARSPVVSTMFTLRPVGTDCVFADFGQLLRKKQATHTNKKQKNRARLKGRLCARRVKQFMRPASDIFPLAHQHCQDKSLPTRI